MPGEARADVEQWVRDVRARDVELSQHVAVIGDAVAPVMPHPWAGSPQLPPGTEALGANRADDNRPGCAARCDSAATLPDDPVAAADEIQRRREEIGFSCFVFGAEVSDALGALVRGPT